jgi:hypothetical protein
MRLTMALLYILKLLLFTVTLTWPPPCSEWFKTTYTGGSRHSYLTPYTHQLSGCYLGKCNPQTYIHSTKRYWKSRNLGNKAGYICNGRLEEWVCWTYLGHWGVSDSGGVQDLAQNS